MLNHPDPETYLKALLSQVANPSVVHLAETVGITPCMVCIHTPPHLGQTSHFWLLCVQLLHTQCCDELIIIYTIKITSCWEPASHSVTGISPGQLYLMFFTGPLYLIFFY